MAFDFGNLNSGLRGSAGNTTWRRVRGRTIQSQKRGKNTSSFYETRAAAGLVRTYREALFFIMSAFCDGMQNSINESFEPTKYGSRRNAFFRLNYSALEKALNGSSLGLEVLDQVMHQVSFTGVVWTEQSGSPRMNGFGAADWDIVMNAAAQAGVSGAYVRSNIGQPITLQFSSQWETSSDPGTATVTGFNVEVATGTTGQTLKSVTINGTNLPSTPNYQIRPGSPTIAALVGDWTGHTFRTSGASATYEWRGTYTIYITDGTRVLFSRDVTFYSTGAGGE